MLAAKRYIYKALTDETQSTMLILAHDPLITQYNNRINEYSQQSGDIPGRYVVHTETTSTGIRYDYRYHYTHGTANPGSVTHRW
ncbi:hypothetical protein KDI_45900 [Dictyobacter arantiisoli]|uniref:Uncharacterized protein n=1 Tax=Dictyobacter arantiisoli TaxID=2014874 RepID=A0A5A5TIS6_9CHLR|nr:hypothetical protein KDI_45900 [Dictyobacter arantiisoli]